MSQPSVLTAEPRRLLSHVEQLIFSAYWFGTNFIWGAFLGPLLASQMSVLAPQRAAGTLGVLYTVAALPALLVPLIAGPLSDRCTSKFGRRRPFIAVGAMVTLLGLGIMYGAFLIAAMPLYIGGYFTIQIGSNIALAAYSGVIPDLVPVSQRGQASGYMAVMSQVGTLFGAVSVGVLVGTTARAELLLGAVYLIFTALTIFGLKETPLDPATVAKQDWFTHLKSLWIDPRVHPDFGWVWLTRALMMTGFYMISPYLLFYLRDVVHVAKPESQSAIVFGVILIAATISGYFGGQISDRTGRKPIVIASTALIALMSLVFIGLTTLNQALCAGLVFGVGYGAYVSVDWALGTDVLPNKDDAGKDMAVWHISMTLPQQFAPYIAGAVILERFHSSNIIVEGKSVATYGLTGYAIVFSLAAVCFLLSGILVRKVKGAK